MFMKIIVAILVLSVVGAGGAALAYNAAQTPEPAAAAPAILSNGQVQDVVNQGDQTDQAGQSQVNLAAQGAEVEPWQARGVIVGLDDFGIDFTTEAGDTVYVELGPPDFWQTQGIELVFGQTVTVEGSINEGMIHAASVTLDNGQVLVLRSETGQPMWSGGVTNGQGQNAGSADGEHVAGPKAQVDEWITIQGTLMSFQGGNMTMGTTHGELIAFQTGNPRFFAEQGVTFQVGDEIIVVGFYQGEQFSAGDITQVASGARVMLRDPNGRPLWAGPGNSNGNGGNGGNQGGNH